MAEKKSTPKKTRKYRYTGEQPAYLSETGQWVEPGQTVESDAPLINGAFEEES